MIRNNGLKDNFKDTYRGNDSERGMYKEIKVWRLGYHYFKEFMVKENGFINNISCYKGTKAGVPAEDLGKMPLTTLRKVTGNCWGSLYIPMGWEMHINQRKGKTRSLFQELWSNLKWWLKSNLRISVGYFVNWRVRSI